MGAFDNWMSVGEAATGTLGAVPVLGEAMNIASTGYHAGAAVYDGVTGDRDGAVNHGAQAIYSGVGSIPAVSEALGTIDATASGFCTGARAGMAINGYDATQVPGGLGDLAGGLAVAGTNALFGADDSNWIADGSTPQGTRGGEIAAGAAVLAGPAGYLAGPAIGRLLGADTEGATSGARNPDGSANGWAQTTGDWLHEAGGNAIDSAGDALSGAADWMDRGVRGIYGL